MKTFYYNAHYPIKFGPPKNSPVAFQFEVRAMTQEDADVMAPFIAKHKNGGTFCYISSVK